MSQKAARFNRKYNSRQEKKILYIFTEGEETEENYFKLKRRVLRNPNIKIEIKGIGHNTESLLEYAQGYLERKSLQQKDEVWLVFDKDDFDKNFDNAVANAQKNDFKVAYSVESFELWLLLHFELISTAIKRIDYTRKLKQHFKARNLIYEKSLKNIDKVKDTYLLHEIDAINNAKKLEKMHGNLKPSSRRNPSTTVYKLVESMREIG